jgi:hypothetical protein
MSLVRDSTPPPSLVTVETATQSSSIPQKRCSPSAECADAHTALGGEVPDDALGARVEPGRDDDELVRVVALVRQRHVEAFLKGIVDGDGAALGVMLLEVGGEDLDDGFFERGSSGSSLSLQTRSR